MFESKRISELYKDARVAFATYNVAKFFIALLPNSLITKGSREDVFERHSVTCSNMAGSPAHNWIFDGKRTHWMAMGTSGGHPTITLVSLHDTVKVTIVSRTGIFRNTEELMAKIEENMDQSV